MAKKTRVTSSRSNGSQPKELQTPKEESAFDLIGTTFEKPYYLAITILKPNEEGYDFKKDEMRIGFQHGYTVKAPVSLLQKVGLTTDQADLLSGWFFLSHPKTGLRPGEDRAPWSSSVSDLSNGLRDYHTLPPKYVWEEGMWLSDFIAIHDEEVPELPYTIRNEIDAIDWKTFPKDKVPMSLFNYWVVSGEGTPGNNRWRIYDLPDEVATVKTPKHPLLWTKKQKDGVQTTSTGQGWQKGSTGSTGSTTPGTSSSTTKTKTLPLGLRVRCTGCGHWFKMNDLSGHTDCCPGTQDGYSDWAVMCDDNCGCRTLDEVSKCKPGFPRKKETPPDETTETAEEGTVPVAATA